MFAKVKKVNEKKVLMDLMAFIVTGTQGPYGMALVPVGHAKEIAKHEPSFVKLNAETPDPAGNISVSATAEGIAAITGKAPEADAATPTKASTFLIEEGFAIPPSKGRGGFKVSIYPFALMGVGQSFFVPATEAHPNPAKGLGSTVSSANKRYAAKDKEDKDTGKDGRTFTVRARTVADGEKSNGARVYRVS